MTKLYIIRGIPGSGKTTLAGEMWNSGMIDHATEADKFMVDDNWDYKFDPEKLEICHKLCQEEVETFLEMGCDVAVSNTFTRKWEMQAYLDMAEKYGAKTTVIVCQGEHENTHGVPQSVVERMKNHFEW